MRRPERLYLQDILESCDAIQRFLNRTDEMAFMQDELIQSAILQKLGCEHELSGSRPPPCPTLKRRAESTKGAAAPSLVRVDAPRQRGFVHSAWKFTSARALRTLMHAHAAEPASSPRPMLNRRAGRTTGAAAPARWGMRMRSAGVPPSSRLQGQDALAPRRNVNPCLRTCPDLRCDVL